MMKRARPRRVKLKRCTSCGEPFRAVRSPQGRWPATCGELACRVGALDRLIRRLVSQRDALADELEG